MRGEIIMKVLLIDDSPEERDAFCKWMNMFYPYCELTSVGDLLTFHELLFESGKDFEYDKVIIDAQLEAPIEIDEDYYRDFLRSVDLTDEEIDSQSLIGWKYYDHFIRKQPQIEQKNVLIKTGFAKSIQFLFSESTPEQRQNVAIICKGDIDYYKDLKKFLNS